MATVGLAAGVTDRILSLPGWLVLVLVFAFPALEASAFVGFVFPGEIAVILGGVAASRGTVPLWAVIAAAVAGAIIGDSAGYLIGRRGAGRTPLTRKTAPRVAEAANSAYPPEASSPRAARATSRPLAAPAVITSGLAVIVPSGRPVNCLRDGVIRDG